MNDPRHHHYVPRFYLRNFASDPEKKKIKTLAQNRDYAVWAERSIESLGFAGSPIAQPSDCHCLAWCRLFTTSPSIQRPS